MTPDVDVVVTDGFTGNVVLKTLEGGMRTLVGAIFEAFGTSPETQAASEVLVPALLPLYGTLDPDNTGGAMLLGVDGLCLISHGSSSATAVVNAIRVAKELHDAEIVESLRRPCATRLGHPAAGDRTATADCAGRDGGATTGGAGRRSGRATTSGRPPTTCVRGMASAMLRIGPLITSRGGPPPPSRKMGTNRRLPRAAADRAVGARLPSARPRATKHASPAVNHPTTPSGSSGACMP